MMLRLVCGPAKCGKTKYIIKRFTEESRRSPVIITPSSESVRYIKKRMPNQGASSYPREDRILTFDHIARAAGPEGSEIREISSLTKYFLIKDIIGRTDLTYFSPVKRFRGFYKIICRFISELKSGEISPTAFLRGIEKKGQSKKDREIYEIYLAYHRELQRLRLTDHEGIFWRAHKYIERRMPRGIEGYGLMLIDGFSNFSPSELNIIKSLAKHIGEICITLPVDKKNTGILSPAEDAYNRLKKMSGKTEETELPPAVYRPPKLNIISCPSPSREIEEIAREITYLMKHCGMKPEDIGVIARDIGIYKEIIGETFAKYGIPYRMSCGRVLSHMPLFRNSVFEFNRKGDVPEQDYFARYAELFKEAFLPYMGHREEQGYARFAEETERIISSGAQISLLGTKISRSAFCAAITEIAEYTEYRQGETEDKGTAVMDAHTGRGMYFPVLFIAGMLEGQFPLQRQEEPLYNDTERLLLRKCGIPVEESKSMQEKEISLFSTTVRAAGEILYLTYPALDANGRDTLPSWFMDEAKKECTGKISVRTVRLRDVIPEHNRIFTEEDFIIRAAFSCRAAPEEAEGIVWNGRPQADRIYNILERAETESGRHAGYNGIITDKKVLQELGHQFGGGHRFSISQFNEYGICPFAFFCKRVLNAEPEKEPEEEILPVDEGTLYHSILRELFSSKDSAQNICERYFRRAESEGTAGNPALWEIKKKEIVKNINSVILDAKNEAEFHGIKKRPAFFEISFGMEKEEETDPASKESPLIVGNIKIQGKIDRIDITDSDMFVVVDYKTGTKNITAGSIISGENLQLPVYIMAAKDILDIGTEPIGGYFYYVKSKRGRRRGELRRYNGLKKKLRHNPLWDKYMRAAKKFIIEYAGGIRKGIFHAVPAKKCPVYCCYKNICRNT